MITRHDSMITHQASKITSTVNVGFSCGKDSLATLDLCTRSFKVVNAFFMWIVPGLSFQENYLGYIENRYGIKILRLPHWNLGRMLQSNAFRPGSNKSLNCPLLKIVDIEREVSRQTGCNWFAYGLTRFDSLERNAMLRRCVGLDIKTRRVYPIMNFTRKAIFSYLKLRKIPLPIDYEMFGRSFGFLWPKELHAIKKRFPNDYEKIREYFPYVDAQIKRGEIMPVSKIRGCHDAPKRI